MTTNETLPAAVVAADLIIEIQAKLADLARLQRLAAEEDLAELEVAMLFDGVDDIKRAASQVFDQFEQWMLREMKAPELRLPTGTLLERGGGSRRKKWDDDQLAPEVAKRIVDMAVDMDTGEVHATPAELVVELLKYAAVQYWRVTQLKEIGINPDKYCKIDTTDPKVIVRKRND